MPSILFGQLHDGEIPVDENDVRQTATPVSISAPPAEIHNVPEFNEFDTDSNSAVGMSTRNVSGDYSPIQKYAPSWAPTADSQTAHTNQIVNVQVNSSGTAAARETQGEFGHGTMAITKSIEPVIRDGGAMGNDYFAAHDPGVQSTMTRETGIQPDAQGYGPSRESVGGVASHGRDAARKAAQASAYSEWYSAVTGL